MTVCNIAHPAPVNAAPVPLRTPAHDSEGVVRPSSATTPSEGSGWIANPSLYGLRPCYATWTFTNYTPPALTTLAKTLTRATP